MFTASLLLAAVISPAPTVIRPVAIEPPRPIERIAPTAPLKANLKPDLVVRDIRMDGDKIVQVVVANEGTAAAKEAFDVLINANLPDSSGWFVMRIGAMAPGGQSTIRATKFLWSGDPRDYAFRPDTFPYDKMTSVTVKIDPPYEGGAVGLGTRCARPEGCVVEADESNNIRNVVRSEIRPLGS